MRYTVIAASFLLILTLALPLAAQYPGRYPRRHGSPYPGGYPTGPSIPIPRESKDKKADDRPKQPQLQSLTGVLRQIDDASVTIVAQDTRTITAKRADTMKVFKKGEESQSREPRQRRSRPHRCDARRTGLLSRRRHIRRVGSDSSG